MDMDGDTRYQVLKADFKLMVDAVQKYGTPAPLIVYIRKNGIKKTDHVSYSKYNEMKVRWDNYIKENNSEPAFVWINKPTPTPTETRPVVLLSDNINGKTTDLKRMQDIQDELISKGVSCDIFQPIGPSAHYDVYRDPKLPSNALVVQIAGGSDAGVISEMAGSWFKNFNKPNRKVVIVLCCGAKTITGLAWLERARDDNYSQASFTGIAHPDQFLVDNGYNFIESSNIDKISDFIYTNALS